MLQTQAERHLLRRFPSVPDAQRGFGLALFLVILVLGTVAVLLSTPNLAALKVDRDKVTERALAQAKAALIGRAARDDARPGSLPCPDTDGDGTAELFAGNDCPAYIGFLPWRTLGLPELRDGSGERLWYVLSPSFRDHPAAEPINSDKRADIEMEAASGALIADSLVALIIAPDRTLPGQARPVLSPSNYVEFVNPTPALAGTPPVYTYRLQVGSNDSILPISQRDLFTVVDQAVFSRLPKIAAKINAFAAKWTRYPFPALFADPGASSFAGSSASGIPLATPQLFEGLLPVAMNTASGSTWAGGAPSYVSGLGTLDPSSACVLEPGPPPNVWLNCTITYSDTLTFQIDATANNPGASFNDVTSDAPSVSAESWQVISATASTAAVRYQATTPAGPGTLQVRLNLDLAKWAQSGLPTADKDPDTSWFFDNEWYRQLYYAVTPQVAFGGSGSCVAGTNCITVNGAPGTTNNKQVILALAGRSINGTPRTSATLSDYLEGQNSSPGDLVFETGPRNFTRNDKIAILAP